MQGDKDLVIQSGEEIQPVDLGKQDHRTGIAYDFHSSCCALALAPCISRSNSSKG